MGEGGGERESKLSLKYMRYQTNGLNVRQVNLSSTVS